MTAAMTGGIPLAGALSVGAMRGLCFNTAHS